MLNCSKFFEFLSECSVNLLPGQLEISENKDVGILRKKIVTDTKNNFTKKYENFLKLTSRLTTNNCD